MGEIIPFEKFQEARMKAGLDNTEPKPAETGGVAWSGVAKSAREWQKMRSHWIRSVPARLRKNATDEEVLAVIRDFRSMDMGTLEKSGEDLFGLSSLPRTSEKPDDGDKDFDREYERRAP